MHVHTGAFNPARFICSNDLSPQGEIACPTCKRMYVAYRAVTWFTHWNDREGDRVEGEMGFCSTSCLLGFLDDEELGHS
jgi:hypothetical protein